MKKKSFFKNFEMLAFGNLLGFISEKKAVPFLKQD